MRVNDEKTQDVFHTTLRREVTLLTISLNLPRFDSDLISPSSLPDYSPLSVEVNSPLFIFKLYCNQMNGQRAGAGSGSGNRSASE